MGELRGSGAGGDWTSLIMAPGGGDRLYKAVRVLYNLHVNSVKLMDASITRKVSTETPTRSAPYCRDRCFPPASPPSSMLVDLIRIPRRTYRGFRPIANTSRWRI